MAFPYWHWNKHFHVFVFYCIQYLKALYSRSLPYLCLSEFSISADNPNPIISSEICPLEPSLSVKVVVWTASPSFIPLVKGRFFVPKIHNHSQQTGCHKKLHRLIWKALYKSISCMSKRRNSYLPQKLPKNELDQQLWTTNHSLINMWVSLCSTSSCSSLLPTATCEKTHTNNDPLFDT